MKLKSPPCDLEPTRSIMLHQVIDPLSVTGIAIAGATAAVESATVLFEIVSVVENAPEAISGIR